MEIYPGLDFLGGPLLAFLALVLIGVETWRPLRRWAAPRLRRLATNGAMALGAMAAFRLAVIPVVVWVALVAERTGFGLLRLASLPTWLSTGAAFLLLDYTVYVWHWLNHAVPFLWRFHNVHHTDLDLDVSTAFRFHAGEVILSAGYRAAQVALIGVPAAVGLVYEIAMEAATEFHHSNWRLPLRLERALNMIAVTPRMHTIHHSVVERETNSNWSVIFSFWDRLHRTTRLDIPHDAVTIGVPGYIDPHELTLFGLLLMPFRRQNRYWERPDGTRPVRPAADMVNPAALAPEREGLNRLNGSSRRQTRSTPK